MTANTITEIIGDKAEIKVDEALMRVTVDKPSEKTLDLLKGFKLHITELSRQYSNNIKIHGGAKNVTD